jgi:hypothetical protein
MYVMQRIRNTSYPWSGGRAGSSAGPIIRIHYV